ncbi:MAG: penicillin-binding protein 2 [Alphaproteobacteria bacterium]|jgi:penicillin-binding protein 2|uniref:penicillin-binding protein 2 n=1 Tax=Candidatus Scatocola faecigallinarum TaxID=2840916 RepID=UPI00034084EF|nr:penicillin-binding protein 2 [Alphaproteobacteria bacterium]CDB53353.1 cell division protein FtsI/penicillin-binding protein 2 [Azospirillum sp. CAG:239]
MNRDNDKGKVLIRRSLIMALIKFLLLMVIIARLYYLQVYQADRYKTLADENRISTRLLVPPRGIIFDRNGVTIASNQQNFQALIVAEQAPNVQETLDAFKKIMPLSEAEEERIKKDLKRNRSFVPIKIRDNLSWEEVSRIQLNAPDLPGIVIDEGLTRYYPFGAGMAHILGYVSSVSDKDVKDDPLLEVPGFKIGKSGIEKYLEKALRGESGNLKLEVNAYGRIMKEIERVDGIPGKDVQLTIDSRLQQKAFELFGEESGAAVLLDVHTGEILAFVSAPSFDPNMMTQGLSTEDWNALLHNERNPLTDKAISGQYSPGSTFKMIVALAALEAGVIKPETRTYCAGKMFLGNHAFHCWKKEGHGHLNVVEALQHSCDIFFYETAQKLGIEKIADMARRFGLGSKINIGLENEKAGLIPDKEWKLRRFGEPWQQGESLISGIGQGYILTTPLQLATMTARLVNGGYEIKPTFLKVSDGEKSKIRKIDVSPTNLELIKEGMYAVVNKPGGTAWRSQFDYHGQRMGGKTGTTQVRRITMKERREGIKKESELPWRLRNHALFVGYAPHDNPKYAVAVLVEHGGGGSSVAAPLAGKILREAVMLDPTREEVR